MCLPNPRPGSLNTTFTLQGQILGGGGVSPRPTQNEENKDSEEAFDIPQWAGIFQFTSATFFLNPILRSPEVMKSHVCHSRDISEHYLQSLALFLLRGNRKETGSFLLRKCSIWYEFRWTTVNSLVFTNHEGQSNRFPTQHYFANNFEQRKLG